MSWPSDRKLLLLLIGGFTLVIGLLVAADRSSLTAMQSLERSASESLRAERAAAQATDTVQALQRELGELYFGIPAAIYGQGDREALAARLTALERGPVVPAGPGGDRDAAYRARVEADADRFIASAREIVSNQRRDAAALTAVTDAHQQVLLSLTELVAVRSSQVDAIEAAERDSFGGHLQRARGFLTVALILAAAVAGATIYFVQRQFGRMAWQGAELARLSSYMIETQETTVRRFSRELHDEFGQTLSAIEANLVALDALDHARDVRGRIEDCIGLVQDTISQAREMAQLLRPSILDDFGLSASLEWLADGVSQRTPLQVRYASSFVGRVRDDIETQVFRIAQEALTNAVRHAHATQVDMSLVQYEHHLTLTIADNGRGMTASQRTPPGLGLVSMRARAVQVGGTLDIQSDAGRGTTIVAWVPALPPVAASPVSGGAGGPAGPDPSRPAFDRQSDRPGQL